MPKIIIRYILLCLVLLTVQVALSQTKSDLIRYGDDAYKAKNYASAAYFYKKVLTISNAGIKETVYPYDLKHSNRDFDEESDKKNIDTLTTDSLMSDSLKTIPEQEYVYDSTNTHLQLTEKQIEYSELASKLGDSYRLDHNYLEAEEWLAKASKYQVEKFPLIKFWYGDILMYNEKYEEARSVFSEFITETISEELSDYRNMAKVKMRSCSYAIKKNTNVPGIKVWMADSIINRDLSNFSVNYFGSETDLIFASSDKEGKKGSQVNSSNLYLLLNGNNNNNVDLEKLPTPIKSPFNEGAATFDQKESRLYFTHWEKDLCGLYYCNNFQGKWMDPWIMSIINKQGYKTMDPTLSKDGKTLYFSSNMPGGFGGMDIWYCSLDRWGDATEPVNMGSGINTPGDEVSPYLHPRSGNLYFSSNGHVGFGGFDVFISKFDEDYGWQRPINLDKPINSSKDDKYYIMDADGKSGYLSSDRATCEECNHGSCLKVYKYDKGLPTFFVDGIVFNAMTDEVLPNAKVTFVDVHEDTLMYELYADESGYYSLNLTADMIYFIKGQKPQFFADANSVSTMGLTESTSFMRDLFLNPIPGEEIEIEGIEYDYDKATLRPESMAVLDRLYSFLSLNDNLILELNSHTDSRGSDEYNINLSQARAESCVEYLVKKGIPRERLSPKGYGETKPRVPNAQTEEDHQRNRRTAFIVLGQDFKVESGNQ